MEYQKKNMESDMSSGVEVEGISDFFRYGFIAYWRERCVRREIKHTNTFLKPKFFMADLYISYFMGSS
jgi:hypothetical protein